MLDDPTTPTDPTREPPTLNDAHLWGLAASATGVALIDDTRTAFFRNRALGETFGYSSSEAMPRLEDLVAPQDQSVAKAIRGRFGGRTLVIPWPPVVTFRHRSGRLLDLAVTEREAIIDGCPVVVQDVRDVTAIAKSSGAAR